MALNRKKINDFFENKRQNKKYFKAKNFHGISFSRLFNDQMNKWHINIRKIENLPV